MNASDLIGQYSDVAGTIPSYTKSGANNGPNQLGMDIPTEIFLDSVNHRLFVSEISNHRVLVFNLNSNNRLVDKVAAYVLGQPDFNSKTPSNSQSGLNNPRSIYFDATTNRLFVAEVGANRVKVFDLSSGITNGMNASYVLGQTDFTGTVATDTQSGIHFPYGITYDANSKFLFVSEYAGSRVKVFDLSSGITSGMNASYVLGQTNFTGSGAANTQSGLNFPTNIALDQATKRLFVSEANGNRVKIFDVATSTIANGENAINILGQTDFTGSGATNTQSGLNSPFGLAINNLTNQIYVAETGGNRVKVFDIATSTIANGENAIHILGQTDFTSTGAANTQSGLNGVIDVAFDSINNYLYVIEPNGNRVKIFDVSSITNGQNAIDLIGQYQDVMGTIVSYTKSTADNGPSALGLSTPMGVLTDSINHRLYVTDFSNNRVLIYNLDSSNHLIDHIPDYVIGQPDFNSSAATSTQSGINGPRDITLDPTTNRLFVAEYSGNRVKVFDVSPGSITNGENALNVIGQTDFTSAGANNTQSGLSGPGGLAFDTLTKRLFVSESVGNRVKVFNAATSTISNGENALNVLGQSTFTGAGAGNTQAGINAPINITIDPTTNRLFVAESGGNRVKIFDISTSTISDNENALNVLGQSDFTSAGAADSQAGMNVPVGVSLDLSTNHLFVSENSKKVKVFDIATSTITNGENALYVIGQTGFTTATASSSQSGFLLVQSVAFDPLSHYLYVVDNGAKAVKIFDLSAPLAGGCSTIQEQEGNTIYSISCGVKTVYQVLPNFSVSTGSGSGISFTSANTQAVSVTSTATSTTSTSTTTYILTPVATLDLTPTYTFVRSLTLKSKGDDVRQLQKFLNSNGFVVSAAGAGSVGNETTLFGPATKAALIRFQKAHNIKPASGYFGSITRSVINGIK